MRSRPPWARHGLVLRRLTAWSFVGSRPGPSSAHGLVLIEPASPLAAAGTPQALAQFGLTQREAAVTLAVLRSQSTVEIAADLVVSPHTVPDHLRKEFEKLA